MKSLSWDLLDVEGEVVEARRVALGLRVRHLLQPFKTVQGFDRLRVGWSAARLPLTTTRGRDTTQEDVEGSPTQSRVSPSIQRILR